MEKSIIIGLIQNVAILLVFGMLYDYVWLKRPYSKSLIHQVINGIFIGIIGIILMNTPWILMPGLIFDTRSIMLSISGLFFGLIPTIIAIFITLIYRINIGGSGLIMGISVIVSSGIIGIIWRYYLDKLFKGRKHLSILSMGIVVHIVMLCCTLLLPKELYYQTLKIIAIPILIIYPAGTLLLGLLLIEREKKKITEEKIADSEQRYRNIFQSNHSVMLILDYDSGKIIDANPAALAFYGYDYDTITNMYIFQINILSEEEIKNEMKKVYSKEKGFFQFKHRTANGQIKDVEVYSGTIEYNNRIVLFSIIHDISERIKTEKQIQNLSSILHESLNEIYIFSVDDLKFIEANKGAIENIGYSIEELRTMTPLELKPLITKEKFQEMLLPLKNGDIKILNFETMHQRKDGSRYPVEVHLQKMHYGELAVYVAFIIDITERIKSQEQILQKEKEFQEIFNSSYEAIMIDDANTGKMIDCNKRTLELYEYDSKEELLSGDIGNLSAYEQGFTEELAQENIKRAIKEGHIKFDWLAKKKNGKTFWVEVSLKKTEIGGKDRIIAAVRDISERKKYEEELIAAKEKAEESDRLKSSFLANLSHEVHTPINSIIGFSNLINQPNLNPEKLKKYTDIIIKSSNQIVGIINQTIEIAEIDAGVVKINFTHFDLNDLIRNIYEEMYFSIPSDKKLELKIINRDIDRKFEIISDPIKISQILVNLVNNSIKYTIQGHVAFGYEINGEKILFKVEDTGIGIKKEDHDRIFSRFYRVNNELTIKESGIGLGMSIVKSYVELLNGKINLYSEEGKGTTITFELPLMTPDKQQVDIPTIKKERLYGNGETILVAEDDDYNYALLSEVLKNSGYDSIRAKNGVEAIEMVRNNNAISLVLMDIRMPEKDGFQALDEIRTFNKEIPIVAVTAYAFYKEKYSSLIAKFNGFIIKPINNNELLKLIKKIIGN